VTPEAFWNNLREGHDGLRKCLRSLGYEHYYDPNPEAPGRCQARLGCFMKVWTNLMPRSSISLARSTSMDPQQRILLEVVCGSAGWTAGHASLTALEGSSTGVFVGITTDDYAQLQMEAKGLQVSTLFCLWTARSIASGRISYHFGLLGLHQYRYRPVLHRS